MRSEHHAQGRQDCVERPIRVGQCFGVGGFPGQLDTEFGGPLLASLEQFWCQIRRDGPCASSGCRDSDAAAAGRYVEHQIAPLDRGGVDQSLANWCYQIGHHGVVVTRSPHCPMLGLQCPIGLAAIGRLNVCQLRHCILLF